MRVTLFGLITGLVLLISSCSPSKKGADNANERIEQRVDSVLALMTLQEKIGQLNQYTGSFDVTGPVAVTEGDSVKARMIREGKVGSMLNVVSAKVTRETQRIAVEESRLGIPLIFGYDVIHGYKTAFPIPLGESASWDLEAIKKSAHIAAVEAAASGIHWTFAPMVDIARDPRWGRVMEGAGEDPYLGSMIAVARVKGFQGDDLSANNTIAACAKHFAAYGFVEAGRDYNTSDMSERTLRDVILRPFKAASDAGVATFMNSFNEIGGVPSTGSKFLQRDILKGEWKFDGFVVSDWGSIGEMQAHGVAADSKQAAEVALNAGSDMDMESRAYVNHLEELVKEGKVSEKLIDDAVRRILRIKFRLGLFDDPYRYCDEQREKELVGNPKHMEAALEGAKRSIVLLKNENNLLPLPEQGKTIAVIGPFADDKDNPIGNWRAMAGDNNAVSLLEGINALGTKNTIVYAKGYTLNSNSKKGFMEKVQVNATDRSQFAQAIAAARKADVVVLALGEDALMSGEARSRTEISLPGLQNELMQEVYKVNKNVVLVLFNGRPLEINWAAENVPAIVEGWLLGHQSGNALAQVLFGKYNPSGKLPITFPRTLGQVPIFYNHKNTGRPKLDETSIFVSRYIDAPNEPQFPFGWGLSYTTFSYSDVKIDKSVYKANEPVKITVTVTNTGTRDGEEVVQLYVRDRVGSVTRPVKELKGFNKLMLKAGESKQVEFTLTENDLAFYNADMKFVAEPGLFDVMVGGNSVDLKTASFELTK